jgi:serine/threonine-protein kinase
LTFSVPGRLAEYELLELVGAGGMGRVYRARHTWTDREVAVKVLFEHLADDEAFVQRFRREAGMTSVVEHPGLITVLDAREADGQAFLVMPYLRGGTLAARLNGGPLDVATTLGMLTRVGDALDALHVKGVVHRDVKPSNILFDDAGAATLGDLGISRRGDQTRLTRSAQLFGTWAYASPEQVRGDDVTGRSDLYSLAVVAYECITGENPFAKDSDVAQFLAHLQDPAPSLDISALGLPAGFGTALKRALAKSPALRQPTCRAFVDELSAALAGGADKREDPRPPAQRPVPVTATKARSAPQGSRRRRRPGLFVPLGGALALGMLAAVVLLAGNGGDEAGAGTGTSSAPKTVTSATVVQTVPAEPTDEDVQEALDKRLAPGFKRRWQTFCRDFLRARTARHHQVRSDDPLQAEAPVDARWARTMERHASFITAAAHVPSDERSWAADYAHWLRRLASRLRALERGARSGDFGRYNSAFRRWNRFYMRDAPAVLSEEIVASPYCRTGAAWFVQAG